MSTENPDEVPFGGRKADRRVPPEYRDQAEQEAWLKFRSYSLRGGLFNLVHDTARQYYSGTGDEFIEKIEDVPTRIRGIARVLARNRKDAEAIAERALSKYKAMSKGPYYGQIIYREFLNILKRIRLTTPLNAQTTPSPQSAARESGADEARRRKKFRELVLSPVAFRKSPCHELLVYSLLMFADWMPRDIVEDLATVPTGSLARSLIRLLDGEEGVKELRIALDAAAAEPGAGRWIQTHWDPVAKVGSWIPPKGTDLSDPEKTCYQRICCLYATENGYSAEHVVAELGQESVSDLAQRLDRWQGRIGAIGQKERARELRVHYRPSLVVSDWEYNVNRRMRAEAARQGREGLRRILRRNQCAPHELTVFLYCHCFGVAAQATADEYGGQPLLALEQKVEEDFDEYWSLGDKGIEACFRSLAKGCRAERYATARLDSLSVGEKLPAALNTWRMKVLREVAENFDDLPLFAFRHNLSKGWAGR